MAGDIDNDGDLDLLVTNNGQTADLLRNDGGSGNNALARPHDRQAEQSRRRRRQLRLTAGARTQIREVKAGSSYLGQNDARQHFGLGTATRADRLEVRWPSGRTEVLQNVAGEPDHHDPGRRRHRWPGTVRSLISGPSPERARVLPELDRSTVFTHALFLEASTACGQPW